MRPRAWSAALIVLLALVLRLWNLGAWSLDGDELYTWYDVRTILDGEPWPHGASSFPLGYLMLAGSSALLGHDALGLRLLPMLFAWGAVAALLLMRRDLGAPRERALAALLAALSPWLLFHAQSARFYGPLLGFATLALMWARPGAGRRPRLAWVALALAVLCHPSAALLTPALWLADADGASLRRRLPGLAVFGALAAVSLLFVDASSPREVLERLISGADPGRYDLGHFVLGLGYNLGPPVGLLALWGTRRLWSAHDPDRLVLPLAGLLPPAALLLAAAAGVSMHQRYALAAVPALLLLAARGWSALPAGAPRAVALALLLLYPAPQLAAHLVDGSRHDTRAVARYLAAHADPEDLLLLEQHAMIELYLHAEPGFADIETAESPVPAHKRHNLARQRRESWLALKASHRGRADEEAFHAWVDEVYTEVARVGRPPWPLVRHDNQYVIYRRTRRLPPEPFVPPTSDPSSSRDRDR